jgi:hypothetical protein
MLLQLGAGWCFVILRDTAAAAIVVVVAMDIVTALPSKQYRTSVSHLLNSFSLTKNSNRPLPFGALAIA